MTLLLKEHNWSHVITIVSLDKRGRVGYVVLGKAGYFIWGKAGYIQLCATEALITRNYTSQNDCHSLTSTTKPGGGQRPSSPPSALKDQHVTLSSEIPSGPLLAKARWQPNQSKAKQSTLGTQRSECYYWQWNTKWPTLRKKQDGNLNNQRPSSPPSALKDQHVTLSRERQSGPLIAKSRWPP